MLKFFEASMSIPWKRRPSNLDVRNGMQLGLLVLFRSILPGSKAYLNAPSAFRAQSIRKCALQHAKQDFNYLLKTDFDIIRHHWFSTVLNLTRNPLVELLKEELEKLRYYLGFNRQQLVLEVLHCRLSERHLE